MINKIIKLVKPGLFLPSFEVIVHKKNKILVKPILLSICAADQRYFNGNRPQSVLNKKLPMALFHEGIGEVIYDPSNEIKKGTKCVLFPGGVEGLKSGANYKQGALFRSSNSDGFCQECIYLDKQELLVIPNQEQYTNFIFTELMSVSIQAINRVSKYKKDIDSATIGIWGDGSMAFLLGIAVKTIYSKSTLYVYGKHESKLMLFSFADKCIHISNNDFHEPLDIVFECVGGEGAQSAINQIIEKISPLGVICLMGVSENLVSINTRKILEKGLMLIGSSRSVKDDFIKALDLIDDNNINNSINKIISKEITIRSSNDLIDAFYEDLKVPFKTIIKLNL